VLTLVRADAAFLDGRLHRDVTLGIENGHVVTVPPDAPKTDVIDLKGKLLLPGFVNGHSHAFQRAIRGRTEFLAPGHERDDFWTWRDAMYAAANALDPDSLYAVSKQAFLEMALAGVTTVGEFHYLHHQVDGAAYADEGLLAHQVVRAARDVGLRICLLRVGYQRAGFQVDPNPKQRRFIDADVDVYLRRSFALRDALEGDELVSFGLAPHSVRAVPRRWLEVIAQETKGTSIPIHMHVAEQPGEIRACMTEYGARPVELIDATGLLNENFTAVHAVHLDRWEVGRLGTMRCTICACPSTERNLGDGIVEADSLIHAGARISLGSDSQAHIDLLAEAQMLEGHLRLLRLRRNVLDPATGGASAQAVRLLDALSHAGSRSLGLAPATLAPGSPADFVAIDLAHPSMLGARDLLTSAVFAASSGAVKDVFVAGKPIVREGRHEQTAHIASAFSSAVAELRW